MQFEINRQSLLKALQSVIGVVERKQTVPILSHAFLELSHETLTVLGTDNEISITSYASVETTVSEGKTTVAAYKLFDICRGLPEDSHLSCKQEGNYFIVQAGRSRFRLATLPHETFPYTELEAEPVTFSIEEKVLYQLIRSSRFAMAQNDVRYFFNGMLWDIHQNVFKVVATDGHRLANCAATIESLPTLSVIVPRKTIMEMTRLLATGEEVIKVSLASHQCCIQASNYRMTSRLINGDFPDLAQFLQINDAHKKIGMERDSLKDALSRMAILVRDKYRGIQLEFSPHNLKLSASNLEYQEEAEEYLSIDYSQQDTFSVAFNVDYLLDVMEVMPAGQVQFVLDPSGGAALLQHVDREQSTYLVMPMRV